MKRLATVCILWFAVGCASEDVQQELNEAMKDARGENMEMRNDFSTPRMQSTRKPAGQALPDE